MEHPPDTRAHRKALNKLRYRERWRKELIASLRDPNVRHDALQLGRVERQLDTAKRMLAEQLAAYRTTFGCEPPSDWDQ